MRHACPIVLLSICPVLATQAGAAPGSIENLPVAEQQRLLAEFERTVWVRGVAPSHAAAIVAVNRRTLGFWFFDNALVRYDRGKLRDQREAGLFRCPVPDQSDCVGGCGTQLSRTYFEGDVPGILRNGFCSHGTTEGGQVYSCEAQGISGECWECDAPCKRGQFRMNAGHIPGNDVYTTRFMSPQMLNTVLENAHQYQDQIYSPPISGAYWRFFQHTYEPLIPNSGSYFDLEQNWQYAESRGDFMGIEGDFGTTRKLAAWEKRACVGLHILNGVPVGVRGEPPQASPAVYDPYWKRYVQLCDWVISYALWLCSQPEVGTPEYNDIFDIWFSTRGDPWYNDRDVTATEPTTWGKVKNYFVGSGARLPAGFGTTDLAIYYGGQ